VPTSDQRQFLVNVADLRRRLGNQRRVELRLTSPGWALQSAAVGEGEPVEVTLDLEAVSGGVTAVGTLGATWRGECRRCLEEVEGRLDLALDEVFEDSPTEGETYPTDGDLIDLAPMLRDAVLLALPLAPLCGEDCPGPAPGRFEVEITADDASDDASQARDPRWAALDALREGGGSAN